MKIAIVACLFAKRNMNINTRHCGKGILNISKELRGNESLTAAC